MRLGGSGSGGEKGIVWLKESGLMGRHNEFGGGRYAARRKGTEVAIAIMHFGGWVRAWTPFSSMVRKGSMGGRVFGKGAQAGAGEKRSPRPRF